MRSLLAWTCLVVPALTAQSPAARDSAIHAVNRLAYGPAPGLVDSIARTGVMRWVNAQLGYRAPGDPNLGWMDDQFPVLSSSSEELVRRFADVRREQLINRPRGDSMAPRRASPEVRELRESLGGLPQATLVRAVLSDNQLGEVMAEFWFNHFNVFMNKGLDRVYTASYVEKTIRPNALGTFRDLLLAVATSPAMLFYLDNVQSVATGSEPPGLAKYERAMMRAR